MSRQTQGFTDGFGLAVDDEEIGAGRALRDAAALLPVAQSVDVEAEARGETFLGEPQLCANRLYVDLGGMWTL